MNILILAIMLLTGCSREPEPLNFGTDQCAHCRMTISDEKFGAEIVNDKGKIIKFDAAECMIKFISEIKNTDGYDFYVINYDEPGKLINADGAGYLVSPEIRSPMGEDISAYRDRKSAEQKMKTNQGNVFSWNEIKSKLTVNK